MLCLLTATVIVLSAAAEASSWAGKSLAQALRELEDQGLRLVFSTLVVRPEMRVESPPGGATPRETLDRLLAPHGLTARPATRGRLLIVPVAEAEDTTRPIEAEQNATPLALTLDEIVVASSYRLYRRQPVAAAAFDREEILRLPHFGDDLYRAIALLPGVASSDFSSRFSLRGGLPDEVLVRLDGLELFEPFHLKDVDNFLSIIDPEIVDSVDLMSGVFPAEYGDRMGGVLEIDSTPPDGARHLRAGVSLTNAWLAGGGGFGDGKGRLLASLRRGTLDFLRSLGEEQEEPGERISSSYWDLFGRLDVTLGPSSWLSWKLLAADDIFDRKAVAPRDQEELASDDSDAYLWLSHAATIGPRLVANSLASVARIDRDRRSVANLPAGEGEARDRQRLDVLSLKSDWLHERPGTHLLKWGFELRRYQAVYDYQDRVDLIDPVAAAVRHRPVQDAVAFLGEVAGDHHAFYLSSRARFWDRLTAEVGARYDRQSWTGDQQVSPRLNLVLDLGRRGALRTGWGIFHQSRRPQEIAVEDGETDFSGPQKTRQWTFGWERQLPGGLHLRLDGYRRDVRDPRPRYENLFDPFSGFPHAAPDRIQVAAQSTRAEGLELFLGRGSDRRLAWWLSYALSSTTERVDGRTQPRSIDQLHALTASVNVRPGHKWNLSLVWVFHSSRPTTAVSAEIDDGGEIVFVPGPYYDESLGSYHRLDVRVSRSSPFRGGVLAFYFDVYNLYGQANPRGFDVRTGRFLAAPDGRLSPLLNHQEWLGILPSFGVGWSF